MKAKPRFKSSSRFCHFGFLGSLLTGGALVEQHAVAEQSVIGNPEPAAPLTTEWQQQQPDEMNVFQPAGLPPTDTLPEVFRYGPLTLRPHATYRFLYGNGIQATLGNQENTAVQELSPGIQFDFGTHWALDYTPTLRFYSSSQFRDTVDHAVALNGGFQYEDWKFGLSHASAFTSTPLIETGAQTDQNTHSTSLSASHAFSPQVSTDLSLNQQISLVSGLEDTYTWSTLDWVNYQFTQRFNVGAGAGGGYVMIDPVGVASSTQNFDQTYEQLQARANWRASGKISFQISGGFEDRQYMSAGASDTLDPIFGASIQYQPFKQTQISLTANRSVSSSSYYLAAQETTITSVGLNVNQQILRKFLLGAGVGYSNMDYGTASGLTTGKAANRSDDVVSFNVRLSHPFLKHGTWALFYQFNDNTSSQSGYGFQSNQTGFEISYSY